MPSSDPIQEKLRQHKAAWNKKVSNFIDDVIKCKQLFNGIPNKFYQEKSSIKYPIPADPKTILGILAGDFHQLVQEGNDIINEQIEYSKNRRKSRKELEGLASIQNSIEKIGSNPITRFWSQISSPFSKEETRQKNYRLNLLKLVIDLDFNFKELQEEILSSGNESIFITIARLTKVEDIFSNFKNYLEDYSKSVNYKDLTSMKDEKIIYFYNDVKKNKDNFDFEIENLENFFKSCKDYENLFEAKELDKLEKGKLESIINDQYNKILSEVNKKFGTNANSLGEAILSKANLKTEASIFNWIKRKKHQLNPFDKTTGIRLDIDKEIEDLKKIFDNCLNSLEKEIDLNLLHKTVIEVGDSISRIKNHLEPLKVNIKGQEYTEKFINLLKKKNLTNQRVDLSDKEEKYLKTLIERKRSKDMMSSYLGGTK